MSNLMSPVGDLFTQVSKVFVQVYWFRGIYRSKQGRYLLIYNLTFLGKIALEKIVMLMDISSFLRLV